MHECLLIINTKFILQFELQESSFPILRSKSTTFTIESPRQRQLWWQNWKPNSKFLSRFHFRRESSLPLSQHVTFDVLQCESEHNWFARRSLQSNKRCIAREATWRRHGDTDFTNTTADWDVMLCVCVYVHTYMYTYMCTLLHCHNGYGNVPQCYVIRTVTLLLRLFFHHSSDFVLTLS